MKMSSLRYEVVKKVATTTDAKSDSGTLNVASGGGESSRVIISKRSIHPYDTFSHLHLVVLSHFL